MSVISRSLVLLLMMTACGLEKPEPVPLIDAFKFERMDPNMDPFGDPPTPGERCDAVSAEAKDFGGEYAYDIDTDGCAHLTVDQPSLVSISEGETMFLRVWHFDLAGPDGGTTTFAVRIGDEDLLKRELMIPGPSGLDAPRWRATADVPAGTPVYFHVRNHGTNSYALIELSVGGPFEPEE